MVISSIVVPVSRHQTTLFGCSAPATRRNSPPSEIPTRRPTWWRVPGGQESAVAQSTYGRPGTCNPTHNIANATHHVRGRSFSQELKHPGFDGDRSVPGLVELAHLTQGCALSVAVDGVVFDGGVHSDGQRVESLDNTACWSAIVHVPPKVDSRPYPLAKEAPGIGPGLLFVRWYSF